MAGKRSKDRGGEKAKFRYSWYSSSPWSRKGKGSMVFPGVLSWAPALFKFRPGAVGYAVRESHLCIKGNAEASHVIFFVPFPHAGGKTKRGHVR